jgi:hypothetical protein
MKRLLTNVVAVLAIVFTGQLIAHPAAYAIRSVRALCKR